MADTPPPLPPDLRQLLPLLVDGDEASTTWRQEIKTEVDEWFRAVARIRKRFDVHLRAASARQAKER
jgi:hypothetical protein